VTESRIWFFRVDRHGWTWEATNPSPANMRKKLVETWDVGAASDVQNASRVVRELRV
jgi:hypothetical protein